jgi:hypothetical protein
LWFYISLQDFRLASDLLTAVEKEACNSSINSGVLCKLIRLLSWETLLIQIIEFLTEWPNHKLSKSDFLYNHMIDKSFFIASFLEHTVTKTLAVTLIVVFWVVTQCVSISGYQRFGGKYHLTIQGCIS